MKAVVAVGRAAPSVLLNIFPPPVALLNMYGKMPKNPFEVICMFSVNILLLSVKIISCAFVNVTP